jgi:hypothetical protein
MDAVFILTLLERRYLSIEGWQYELDSEESELKINGIVYNEMKGSFHHLTLLYANTKFTVPGYPLWCRIRRNPDFPEISYEVVLDFHGL